MRARGLSRALAPRRRRDGGTAGRRGGYEKSGDRAIAIAQVDGLTTQHTHPCDRSIDRRADRLIDARPPRRLRLRDVVAAWSLRGQQRTSPKPKARQAAGQRTSPKPKARHAAAQQHLPGFRLLPAGAIKVPRPKAWRPWAAGQLAAVRPKQCHKRLWLVRVRLEAHCSGQRPPRA